uniref:Uncharacterized protein n=1 Tax=Glossina pallidipes TaxID=7398 RepID=A0A1B0AJH8_GLOPL
MQKDEKRKDPHQRNNISHAFAQSVVYYSRSNEMCITSMSLPSVIMKYFKFSDCTASFTSRLLHIFASVDALQCSDASASISLPCLVVTLTIAPHSSSGFLLFASFIYNPSGIPAVYCLFTFASILTSAFMRSASFSKADTSIAATFLALIANVQRSFGHQLEEMQCGGERPYAILPLVSSPTIARSSSQLVLHQPKV